MSTIIKTIERTYKPCENPHPLYEVERCITTRKYTFDVINTKTGEIIGKTTLYWKHDTEDEKNINIRSVYHGCSYRFSGYNPIPVTDWFHGVPLDDMRKWCEEHGLINMKFVAEFKNITYADSYVYDSCNGEWVHKSRRYGGRALAR